MWLVPRDTRGLTSRTPVPGVVREALVRWYTGEGEDSDHRASVIMVVKARDHHQWIACDCLGPDDARVRELEERVALDGGAREADLERLRVGHWHRDVPRHAFAHGDKRRSGPTCHAISLICPWQ